MADDNQQPSQPVSLEDYTPDQLASMGRLYATLVQNPQTRYVTLKATKHVSPQTPIPEIDVLDTVGKAMKPHLDEIAQLKKEKLERDVADRIEKSRRSLYSKGYTKEEVESVEKIMLEKHIPDHETAGEFFRLQAKTAEPSTPSYHHTRPTLPLDKEKSKAAGGFKKFFLQDAHDAVDDLRAGRVKLNS